jgi:hypothetical protein
MMQWVSEEKSYWIRRKKLISIDTKKIYKLYIIERLAMSLIFIRKVNLNSL